MGMAWEISGKGARQMLAKNGAGAGFSSWIVFDPRTKHGVVVLTNAQGAEEGPASLGRAILQIRQQGRAASRVRAGAPVAWLDCRCAVGQWFQIVLTIIAS